MVAGWVGRMLERVNEDTELVTFDPEHPVTAWCRVLIEGLASREPVHTPGQASARAPRFFAPQRPVPSLPFRPPIQRTPTRRAQVMAERTPNRTTRFWDDFKSFAFSDSLIKVAVAFMLGAAGAALIKSLVDSFITPLIAALFGQSDFSNLTFTINGSVFTYGSFINALIAFVLIALVLFIVVKVVVRVMGEKAEKRSCDHCIEDVSIVATRCPHCTGDLTPVTH
jgi:large conductance mechanosensitive channel